MVVGFDVHHCGKRTGPSIGAMVSTTNESFSKYYSNISFHGTGVDLSQKLSFGFTSTFIFHEN
jgi:hypothetical protein